LAADDIDHVADRSLRVRTAVDLRQRLDLALSTPELFLALNRQCGQGDRRWGGDVPVRGAAGAGGEAERLQGGQSPRGLDRMSAEAVRELGGVVRRHLDERAVRKFFGVIQAEHIEHDASQVAVEWRPDPGGRRIVAILPALTPHSLAVLR